MAEQMQSLAACVVELHRSWGIDPEREQQVVSDPTPTETTVRLLMRRYPSLMRLLEQEAFVPVRLTVDAKGAPTSCVVQIAAVVQQFKDAVCDSFKNGFEPARDATGAAVPGLFTTIVAFTLD